MSVQLLTVAQVAERLHRSIDSVYKAIAAGELGSVRLSGVAIRVTEQQLVEYLERRTRPARDIAPSIAAHPAGGATPITTARRRSKPRRFA